MFTGPRTPSAGRDGFALGPHLFEPAHRTLAEPGAQHQRRPEVAARRPVADAQPDVQHAVELSADRDGVDELPIEVVQDSDGELGVGPADILLHHHPCGAVGHELGQALELAWRLRDVAVDRSAAADRGLHHDRIPVDLVDHVT